MSGLAQNWAKILACAQTENLEILRHELRSTILRLIMIILAEHVHYHVILINGGVYPLFFLLSAGYGGV